MTRTLVVAAALVSLVAGTVSPKWDAGHARSEPVRRDRDLAPLRALVAFARSPSDATWSNVPFADDVYLGLGSELLELGPGRELRDPEEWKLERRLFRDDLWEP